MTTTLLPSGTIAVLTGICDIASAPDKPVARMKLVPVTSGIAALQLVSAVKTRLLKLQRITGGVVSLTVIVCAKLVVLPELSAAIQSRVIILLHETLGLLSLW